MGRHAAAFVLAVAVLGGCGKQSPQEEVRATLEGFARATAERDYQALCDRYFSPRLIAGLERAGLPCEAAIRPQLSVTQRPELTIRSITVDGDTARARVRTTAANQPPSEDTIALTRERGEWRIASLAEAGPDPAVP